MTTQDSPSAPIEDDLYDFADDEPIASAPSTPSSAAPTPSTHAFNAYLWREGKILVIREGATLPEACPMTNETIDLKYSKFKFEWTPASQRVFYWFLKCGFGAIGTGLAASMVKRYEVVLPLSEKAQKKRLMFNLIGWGGLGMIGLAILSVFAFAQWGAPSFAVPIVISLMFVGLIVMLFGHSKSKLFPVAEIGYNRLKLKGVHPDYLARFQNKS